MTIKNLMKERNLYSARLIAIDTLTSHMVSTDDGEIYIRIPKSENHIEYNGADIYLSTSEDIRLFLQSIADEYKDKVRINDQLFEKLDISNVKLDENGDIESCAVNVGGK